ncbi:hypothetical protein JTB14_012576 [Gonioctena quinquepunctata]|nr:hypothetical protein JTB14_012576 [Gonioctena quinquepunctata]
MDAKNRIRKNIVREILRECFPRKLKPNEHFVAFFVKLLLLDPSWGITENLMIGGRANVQKLVKYIISQLENQFTLPMITLKMQFFFTCTLENINKVITSHREDMTRRLKHLKEDIISSKIDRDHSVELLRKKIATYATFISGLGNPLIELALEEAICAVKSILDDDEAKSFSCAPPHTKEAQLEQMNKLVCGIRLFNKESDKGGIGIPDLQVLLERAISAVRDEVQITLLNVMEKVNLLTTVVDKCYVVNETDDKNYTLVTNLAPYMENVHLEHIKDLLILFRQYEVYVRNILEKIDELAERSTGLYISFDLVNEKIRNSLSMRIAVPVAIIFPFFEDLSKLWAGIQDQVVLLWKIHDVLVSLETYTKNVPYNKEFLEDILQKDPSCTDAQRLEETIGCVLKSDNEAVPVFRMENFEIDKLRFQVKYLFLQIEN